MPDMLSAEQSYYWPDDHVRGMIDEFMGALGSTRQDTVERSDTEP